MSLHQITLSQQLWMCLNMFKAYVFFGPHPQKNQNQHALSL